MTLLSHLDITGTHLIRNRALSPLRNLVSLDLTSNFVISDGAFRPPFYPLQIESLSLTDNSVISDAALLCLPCLTSLDLTLNDLITISAVSTLTNLRHLNLTWFSLIDDEDLSLLTSLTSLLPHRQEMDFGTIFYLTSPPTVPSLTFLLSFSPSRLSLEQPPPFSLPCSPPTATTSSLRSTTGHQ